MIAKTRKRIAPTPRELQGQLFVECLQILVATNKRSKKVQGPQAEMLFHAIQAVSRAHNIETTKRQATLNLAFARVRDAAAKLLEAMRALGPEALDDLRISIERVLVNESPAMANGTYLKAIVGSIRELKAAAIDNIASPRSRGRYRPMGKVLAVIYARELFLMFRVDKPTNYDNGDFVKFCKLMWEISTGENEAEFKRQIHYVLKSMPRPSFSLFGTEIANGN